MKIILFFILMVLVSSCDPPYIEDNPYLPNKDTLVNEVTNRTFKQLKEEKELYPCGIGSRMMDQVKMLALSFNYYKQIDIPQARDLLMAVGLRFLNNINSNEKICPFLDNYPFQPKNIQIRIFLQKPDGSEPDAYNLAVVSLIEGTLRYKVNDPETNCLSMIYEETYAEAKAKLSLNSNTSKNMVN